MITLSIACLFLPKRHSEIIPVRPCRHTGVVTTYGNDSDAGPRRGYDNRARKRAYKSGTRRARRDPPRGSRTLAARSATRERSVRTTLVYSRLPTSVPKDYRSVDVWIRTSKRRLTRMFTRSPIDQRRPSDEPENRTLRASRDVGPRSWPLTRSTSPAYGDNSFKRCSTRETNTIQDSRWNNYCFLLFRVHEKYTVMKQCEQSFAGQDFSRRSTETR